MDDYWLVVALTPESWQGPGDHLALGLAQRLYIALFLGALAMVFGRAGNWAGVWRRYVMPVFRQGPAAGSGQVPVRTGHRSCAMARVAGRWGTSVLPTGSPHDARAGLMNDVDHARIERAWQSVRSGRNSLAVFTDTVLRHGAAACGHPSGARDLPVRTARHDLLTRQVRIGTAVIIADCHHPRNPAQHRGVGLALDPDVLGTSLLAVGPPGSGKTTRLVRPVVESLCLQALAGQAVVVAVGTAGRGTRAGRRVRRRGQDRAAATPRTTSTSTAAPPTPTRRRASWPRRWSGT